MIRRAFEKARADLFYPPIEFEIRDVSRSYIDFTSKIKIILSENQAKKLSFEALVGLFHHELNHWVRHPYDLKTLILESYWLEGWKNIHDIRNAFDDIVVNLDLLDKGLKEVLQVYREIEPYSYIENILRAVLTEITGSKFGCFSLSEEMAEKVEKLVKIDYLDTRRSTLKVNLRRFAEIIGEREYKTFFISFNFTDFPEGKIRRALKEIAGSFERKEFKNIFRFVGIDRSTSKFELDADVEWYLVRASNYIRRLNFRKSGSLYPNEIKDFCLEDSISLYNPIESYLKFIPGIAKKYDLKDFEGFERNERDIVIIIDSSGSMRDPRKDRSLAVLMGFAIAKLCLDMGWRVGVINFSGKTETLQPTRSYDIFKYIKTYQGGGTFLDVNKIKRYLKSFDAKYILITDGGIENLDEVKDVLSNVDLNVIWIKSDVKGRKEFERIRELSKIYDVESERDIQDVLRCILWT